MSHLDVRAALSVLLAATLWVGFAPEARAQASAEPQDAGTQAAGTEKKAAKPAAQGESEGSAALTGLYAAPPKAKLSGFKPRSRGAPAGRVAGGSRGRGDGTPGLAALVPGHVAKTMNEAPSLFWYTSGPVQPGVRVVFALNSASTQPIVETELERPGAAGIHRVRLSELGVQLESGVEYEWSVALVLDDGSRSQDVVAAGWIDRVAMPGDLVGVNEGGLAAVSAYGNEGLWYDAMTSLADLIDERGGDPALETARLELLKDVGLDLSVDPVE